MDRRSFMLSLFGGLAAASVGGMAIAQAATAAPAAAPLPNPEELAPALKDGLDKADAEFSQVVVRDRVVVRRPRPYRRPVVVRRTVVVRRPRPYRRPVVVRRRVIYR
ncbi:hypothetical protein [Bosea sp. (in: a-proteobacteria)]|uniref:hypothetical protein n=1 Tax=Bosea sp. (in: a-proteobacteria) TaxID=1871050 RepID=UPI002DDD69D3|nr:hypothetical protein [Bosea sp. (in: a-proteobacteria)]HEV2512180.1 hypothetical protein [Bosea sp. (in: a-proteobacteria)]